MFSFEGRIGRRDFALASLGIFFSQHAITYAALIGFRGTEPINWWWFAIIPLRSLVALNSATPWLLLAGLAYFVLAAWGLAALAFRRATDAGVDEVIAAQAIVPLIQIWVIFGLMSFPSISSPPELPKLDQKHRWASAAHGMLVGMSLTIVSVAAAALLFGVYGFGIFFVTPFVIGLSTAYIANRTVDLEVGQSSMIVAAAAGLGGIGLVMAAIEGIVCIILASPLGLGMALVGGLFGRAIARRGRGSTGLMVRCIAVLPLVFAVEAALPSTTTFETRQEIDVDAPASTVWPVLLHTGRIREPLSLPFRLGIAYPVRGDVEGTGIGAIRRGEFSTGTAIERVTEWSPLHRLGFDIVTDIPAMRELSPYAHVHAPHVEGYFKTSLTRFDLEETGDKTRITLTTFHELRLDPILYWLPMARRIVEMNNARVLAHIGHELERRQLALSASD